MPDPMLEKAPNKGYHIVSLIEHDSYNKVSEKKFEFIPFCLGTYKIKEGLIFDYEGELRIVSNKSIIFMEFEK